MNYQEVEGYAQAKAEYDGAITAAKAAKDELSEMRAELAWRNKVDGFKDTAAQMVTRQQAVDNAKLKARADFPHAPEVIYASMSDPDAILAAAQAAHTAIAAAMPPPGQQQAPAGQQWPSTPGGTTPATPGTHKWDDKNQWDADMSKLREQPKSSTGAFDSALAKQQRDFVVTKLWGKELKNAQ